MTIATFCRDQLLSAGPLAVDELAARALAAGVTRARNPQASIHEAVRHRQIELLDGRWVTPGWLLEGRCLTAPRLPYRQRWYGELDADLGLLGNELADAVPTDRDFDDATHVLCLKVTNGQVTVTTIATPEVDTLEVAALSDRLSSLTPQIRYGDHRRSGLRAVAQLMVDDPTTFRRPLPPLSTWVPALVEDARRRAKAEQQTLEWHEQEERRRRNHVELDDCTAIEVELASQRAGVSVRDWVLSAIDYGLELDRRRPPEPRGVVIALGERGR